MAVKLDLSGVKSFFFEKGEKVGMFACAAVALVLVGFGMMGGIGANTGGYASSIKSSVQRIQEQLKIGNPAPPTVAANEIKNPERWDPAKSDFPQGSFFPTQDTANYKRLNPRSLGILNDPQKKHFQLTYINGTYQAYKISHNPATKVATTIKTVDAKVGGPGTPLRGKGPGVPNMQNRPAGPGAPGAAGTGLQPIIVQQPLRSVLVDTVFPISEQMVVHRRALRKSHEAELDIADLPRFLGSTVHKYELAPGGKEWSQPSFLIKFDPNTNKVELDRTLQQTLREALPDDQLAAGAPFAFQGLVMMLPKLSAPPDGFREYPKAELEGIDWDNLLGGGVGQPGGQPLVRPGAGQGFGGGGVRQAFPPPGGVRQGLQPGAANPGGAGAIGVDIELNPKTPWNALSPDLIEKFTDKFFPLDPNGIYPDPDEGRPQNVAGANAPAPFVPNRPGFGQPNAGVSPYQGQSSHSATSQWAQYPMPPMPAALLSAIGPNPGVVAPRQPVVAPGQVLGQVTKPYEALVRFIDVGVKPGYTYKYAVQVWLANPNYRYNKAEVQFQALTEIPYLAPAPAVETPSIEIPGEYRLYAIDQKPDNPKIFNGSDDKEAKSDQVALQIHRWVEKAADLSGSEYVIGDWAIAERLLLRRGDAIGRVTNIELPIWNEKHSVYEPGLAMSGAAPQALKKNGFEKIGKAPAAKKVGAELGEIGGTPVNFAETTPPAVLVDFDGGKRTSQNIRDESAAQLLILNADGKLVVRSSRADSDPDTAEFKARQKRIDDWKAKVEPLRNIENPMGGNPAPQPNNAILGGNRKG